MPQQTAGAQPQTASVPPPAPCLGTIGASQIPDLIAAFVLQNSLPQNAEQSLKMLPQETALAVMRAGPLAGEDRVGALMQRIQQVAMELQQQQLQQQQQMQQHMMQMQQQGMQQCMPGAASLATAGAPPPPPGQPSPEMVAACQAAQTGYPGVMVHPQMQQQAMYAQAGMHVMGGMDPLAHFCLQNGIDAAVQQVLRSAPPDLQIRVMNEGPLLGGNPSEVLLKRVRRVMGHG